MNRNRNIFEEIMDGVDAIGQHREGGITLTTHTIEEKTPLLPIDADTIIATRKKLNLSINIFAQHLRITPRTLKKWEQGETHPNPQAAALILMANKFPDTLTRLASL
ncbi:helix-turn-helix domain-containing protein [Desulfococcaceae bacterium HSG9]|nr:helix-turn-helix domain-containing protein [Desulfococcaceae bacterium HSG9]